MNYLNLWELELCYRLRDLNGCFWKHYNDSQSMLRFCSILKTQCCFSFRRVLRSVGYAMMDYFGKLRLIRHFDLGSPCLSS